MKAAREHATNNGQTYFVTSETWERRALFRAEVWARLFFRVLLGNRKAYLLHEFVLMPDHFHLLISPSGALERAVQLIKGGFSYRAKKELGPNAEVWQRGFRDHRIRDWEDYEGHVHYIHLNPVKKHLCERPEEYRYSSAFPGWKLDPIPQGLKPVIVGVRVDGTTEVVPLQNKGVESGANEFAALQNKSAESGTNEVVSLHYKGVETGAAEVVPIQNKSAESGAAEVVPVQCTASEELLRSGK